MARKVTPAASSSAAERDSAAEELAIMNPDITLTLGEESVVVSEYSFWDAMDVVYGEGRRFLDDVVAMLEAGNGDAWEQVRSLIGRHRSYLLRAIARSVGRGQGWVEGLSSHDADALFSTWWAVNARFFLREATVVITGRLAAKRSAGPKSSPLSPAPDSAAPTASATDTPSGN